MADSKLNGHSQNQSQITEKEIEDPDKSQSASILLPPLPPLPLPLPLPLAPLPPLLNPDAPKRFQRLSDIDLTAVRVALGAPLNLPPLLTGEPSSSSFHPQPTTTTTVPSHSRLWEFLWPPHNVPPGLYKTVLTNRHKSQLSYHLTATLYNACVIIQLLLGACITALSSTPSSTSSSKSTAVTVLAAANTFNAGVVALLHNSGLPNRLRNDWNEYEKVEMHLLELCMTGVVPEGMTKEGAVDAAFRKYGVAKETVRGNKPAVYAGIASVKGVSIGAGGRS